MKNLKYIILFVVSYNCFSQDTRLFDNVWYLQNLVVNSTAEVPPSTASLFINDDDPDYDLSLAMCADFLTNFIVFNDTNSSFSFVSDWGSGASDCTNSIEENYKILYYSFYVDNDTSPFNYEIIMDADDIDLVITSAIGDQAFYSNQLLNTNDVLIANFSIFPNPAQNVLRIDAGSNQSDLISYRIITLLGQALKTSTFDTADSNLISISALKTGVYFLEITDSNGAKIVKQFVKK